MSYDHIDTEVRTIACSFLSVLADHWGKKPMEKELLFSRASYDRGKGDRTKEAYDFLRKETDFVLDYGPKGLGLNTSNLAEIRRFFLEQCGYPKVWVDSKLKHLHPGGMEY